MLASRITTARRKITSSVFWLTSLRWEKSWPMPGRSRTPGIVSSMLVTESCIRPPSTATWPLCTRSTDSISRVWITGIRLAMAGMLQPPIGTGMPQGLASAGFGSAASVSLREIVGRRLSRMLSFSLICGTTLMMKPTGTELTVVVKVVVATLAVDVVLDWIVKYTRLSTTLSTAVWLLITLTLGLESTRTSPKDSSSLMVAEKPIEAAAASMMKAVVLIAAGVAAEDWRSVKPLAPLRTRDQSMPRWYWLLSCTSITVTSISTWRLALAITWS